MSTTTDVPLSTAARVLVAFVALQHLGFFVLEAFLWTTPAGLQVFAMTPLFAETTRAMAANQGTYNAFLAAALVIALVAKQAALAQGFARFGLACVVVAGVVGAITVDPMIMVVQGVPALLALTAVAMPRR